MRHRWIMCSSSRNINTTPLHTTEHTTCWIMFVGGGSVASIDAHLSHTRPRASAPLRACKALAHCARSAANRSSASCVRPHVNMVKILCVCYVSVRVFVSGSVHVMYVIFNWNWGFRSVAPTINGRVASSAVLLLALCSHSRAWHYIWL